MADQNAPLGGLGRREAPPAPKHAFLIMAHADQELLATLLSLIDDVRNDIYLHIDRKSVELDPEALSGVVSQAALHLVTPIGVNWGGFSQIECELALLKSATREAHSYYHLLSGADLPLVGQSEFHKYFEMTPNAEFVDIIPGDVQPTVRDRVALRHFFNESSRAGRGRLANRLVRRVDRSALTLQRHLGRSPLDALGQSLRWGSQWFSITHDCAEYVLRKEQWIRDVFRWSVCGDELFLQTLVGESVFNERLVFLPELPDRSTNLRLIDWPRGRNGSPYTWRSTDLDVLLEAPRRGYLFARKFNSKLDHEVIAELVKALQ